MGRETASLIYDWVEKIRDTGSIGHLPSRHKLERRRLHVYVAGTTTGSCALIED